MDPVDKHVTDEALEQYSLGRLSSSRTATLEEHLLVCQTCRDRLDRLEPFNLVHDTEDGPFHSRVTKLRTGLFFARHWSLTLEGGKEFGSLRGAKNYLLRTFCQMFPGHTCSDHCGSTKPADNRLP